MTHRVLRQALHRRVQLKELGVNDWPLDAVALSKQQAYAAHVQIRRPSMTARIQRQRQIVEIICFLRVTLLELTDMALLQASRRSLMLLARDGWGKFECHGWGLLKCH